MKNKNHWYDGSFYDFFIAPNQDELFKQIGGLISKNSNILDVGCGTGRFGFSIANNCKSLLGIDLSIRNINKAQSNLNKNYIKNLNFQHKSLNDLYLENNRFDFAIITYVIHEVNENERISLLKEISEIADKIIVGDYIVPRPKGFNGKMSQFIEFLAGKEHYTNYKNFILNGGIPELAIKANLKIESIINTQSSTNQIFILTK